MGKQKNSIAVIGMACRFPGAKNLEEFWSNLISGKDSISHFTADELVNNEFESLRNNPDYVAARGILTDIDMFDAGFFNMTPNEARETDPQQRVWLETAWEALEHSGCETSDLKDAIGVFAGGSRGNYLFNNIMKDKKILEKFILAHSKLPLQLASGNDISFLATQTAYKFNLRGPAINVQSACSTSLVAIIQACQSLFSFESDICLAGGVSITVPQENGYIYQEGGIMSPDGYCRPFDQEANGTVLSNGVGAVVLKRTEDAIRDHDTIYGQISGWALNNDGSNKVSYAAPSIDGQADVIMMAQSFAEVSPEDIGYIEAHGTATLLGDPIEISALTKAFKAKTTKKQFCGIGSVKSNIGHTDAAAGVAGFIKACLSTYYKKIPASLHFTAPNPQIDFENSPFYVQKELKEWNEKKPLITGVSSFGIGGTNAHLIIEEPPTDNEIPDAKSEWPELLLLSAKSNFSLENRKKELIEFIKTKPEAKLTDIAFTLGAGRTHMLLRSFLVVSDLSEINNIAAFKDGEKDDFISKIAFMFPGQGAQYVSMGRDLYYSSELFRQILDGCFKVVRSIMNVDLKSIIFEESDIEAAQIKLASTHLAQPALLIIEYALTKVLEELNIRPDYLIGHSIGEYTAACIAGVFDLDTALKIVIRRGQLMQQMPKGKMLAIRANYEDLLKLKSSIFEIAADNSAGFCTISFSEENNEKVRDLLDKKEITYLELNTSHAFHSASFDPILNEFEAYVDQFEMNAPLIPFISCLTGKFITPEESTSGKYWAQQLRNTVHFREGISILNGRKDVLFLEVGPNTHLSSLVKENDKVTNSNAIITTLGKHNEEKEKYKIIRALGYIFNAGLTINIPPFLGTQNRRKISLPVYHFKKIRHWIDAGSPVFSASQAFKSFNADVSKSDNDDTAVETPAITIHNAAARSGGEIKSAILNIWKSQIGISEIAPDDNFFELGGHSMLALQIISRIKEDFHQKISLKSFLDNPTVNSICSLLKISEEPGREMYGPADNIDLSFLPLSNSQKRIWIFSRLDSDNPSYNISSTYSMSGELDIDLFQKSINILFERHFILNSVFKQREGNPYAEIINRPVALDFQDFSNDSSETAREKILAYIGNEARKCFDLESGPLYRLFLFKQERTKYIFHSTIHHLIFDGWSGGLFVHELKRIYQSLVQHKKTDLEDVRAFYFEYFKGLNNNDFNYVDKELARFWVENLKNCPPVLNFPYDFQRKEIPTGFGEYETIEIPAECTCRLREISRKENATLFATVLSAIGILIQKYSGEDDFCIGTHVSNRPQPYLEKLFGMFVNTIPVRIHVEQGIEINNLIRNTKNALLEAIAHQDLPFEDIISLLNPERYSNVNPLFQISVVWLYNPYSNVELEGLSVEHINIKKGISPFDITIYLTDKGNHIEGNIEYNIDILRRDTIIQLKDNLLSLLQNLSTNSDQMISEISMVSEKEEKKIAEFNNTSVPLPECLIQNYFEKQSLIHASKMAVISGNSTLSYKDLEEKSNQIARHLLSLGVESGDIIGICLERSVQMIVAVLGVLKAGGCYLPLDPLFPDERIQYMFEDSGAKILITQSSLNDKFMKFTKTQLVLVDSQSKSIGRNSIIKPEIQTDADSPAYIIYTSGSTGKPKGVRVNHKAVINLIQSMSVKPGIDNHDNLLSVVTLSFDMSVYELFLTLSNGATLVVAESSDLTTGTSLIDLINKHDITVIQATPSFWQILLMNDWKGKKDMKALCGGEPLSPTLIRQLFPKVGEFWNCYGPTETTVFSTCCQVKDENDPIHVGKPFDNTTIYILDRNNQILPIGIIGEVAIGGVGVSSGYLNRSELTHEKFINLSNGERIYKSGDLGRYLYDGNIELFGRADNQIKIRGFRIEPGEIETLLSNLEGVRESVVKIHRFDENDERLVAFINRDEKFNLSSEEIKRILIRQLPSYMIPACYLLSNGFPHLPNGKIDKKALVYKNGETEQNKQTTADAVNDLQKALIAIWEKILKSRNISIRDDFFDLGGNSLLGIRVINKIREDFGVTLTFRELIRNSDIYQLSLIIESQTKSSAKSIELVHLDKTDNLPLTNNQKRLWLISQFQPEEASYIIPLSYRFRGFLNINVFQKSLELLFERHHIVFSVFREVNSQPVCKLVRGAVEVTFLDFSNLEEKKVVEEVSALINMDLKRPFDLSNGPLYRLALIKAAENEFYFHASFHHIIFDGWSANVFVNDLCKIYNSLLAGKESDLEDLEFQIYDYAQWESGSVEKQDSLTFWEENLKGCSPLLNFPYDFQRSEKSVGRANVEKISLSGELSEKLKMISKQEGASLFSTLMTLFGIAMHKYSGDNDLNLGLPIAYRPHSKLEKIFGMFVNTVAIRLKYEKSSTFRDLLKYSDETAMNAISHQDVPFERVVELVKQGRIPGANPLFQVAFAWQNNLGEAISLEGIKSEKIYSKEGTSAFDMILFMWENNSVIEGELEYNTDLLRPETITRLRDNFLNLANKLVDNADEPVSSVSMLTTADKKLIDRINNTQTVYPGKKTIAMLFEEQVLLYPDKTALVFKDESFTYRKLNERANQLSRTLVDLGVNANTPVGILTDKSAEMIVGILAIIKAGGAYVPIDPEYPEQRIHFIIEDSGCRILLIQERYYHFEVPGVMKLNLNVSDSYSKDKTNPGQSGSSSDLAYIMYTSGTTGKPKGSVIQQYSVIRLVRNTNYIDLSASDRLLLTGAIVFDATTFEIWGMLLNGGTLYIAEKETILNPVALGNELINNDITILWLTSALFTLIAEQNTEIFRKLNFLLSGGDILSAPHINKVRLANPNLKVINCYGPTENTTFSTTYLIECFFDHNIPIGKPISNSTTYIFDKYLNYQPIGLIGELYVGGEGLSKGYLNRDDLNRVSFIDNPLNPGEKLYKTGDLARWLPDGNIEFHGRADSQLKIRGFRVEPEEIESVITEIEGVVEAVIKAVKVEEGDYRLVAFLNVSETFTMEPKDIIRILRTKLPSYMVPSALKCMNGFPKTINGKTDKKALNADLDDLTIRPGMDEYKFTPTEEIIHNIWCKILKTDRVSNEESFYEIGGNSLLGLRLINMLREKLGISLNFKELVMNSTISQLAALIDVQIKSSESTIELVHQEKTVHLPLTRNQKRLWVLSKFQTEKPQYTISLTIKLSGILNKELFVKSLDLLFKRHIIVFSVIKEDQGNPYCDLLQSDVKLSYSDFSNLPENEKSERARGLLKEDSGKPFDLENGPLYRLYLIKKAKEEHIFHISIHHIIFDGWSVGVFSKDLSEIYNCLSEGKAIGLEQLYFQQYDYAHWENKVPDNEESIGFWKNNLTGCSVVLNFPFDFKRKDPPSGHGHLVSISLSKTLSDSLRKFSKTNGLSLFTTLMGAFGILMHKYSGDDDLNIGLPVAYRPHTKLEKIFGMFVNTIVVRLKYDREHTFREILEQSQNAIMNSITHQDLPFDKVVEIVNPERIPGANPLFQIAFEWQNNLNVPLELKALKSEIIHEGEGASIFDLSIALRENGDIIEGELNYNIDILTQDTVLRCKEKYIELLLALVDNPDRNASDYSLISTVDKLKLKEFNSTNAEILNTLVQDSFQNQCKIHADSTAIISGKSSITYGDLDKRSNQLAHYITSLGASKKATIGIYLERTIEAVTSVLAVLKAGCCYLPLDPSFPVERLEYMLNDSGAAIVISTSQLMGGMQISDISSIILVDKDRDMISSLPVSKPEISIDPDQPAYIIYTSGSTGKPKGVPVHHKAVVNLIESMSVTPGFSRNDRLLAVTTLSFDMSVYELFLPLSNGATLVIAGKGDVTDGSALINLIENHDITIIQATPSFWQILLLCGWNGKSDLKALCGGEAITPGLVRQLLSKVGEFWNCYGPTEATVYATCCKISDPEERIHIGKPLNNTRIYILDKSDRQLPFGIRGEVAIGGVGLSKGYHKRKELTAGKFIKTPDGEVVYKTGDLGRYLEDGNIELFGRSDNQIKLRGFRIEPGEIENQLASLDHVTDAIVKIQSFGEGDERLIAFLSADKSFNLSHEQINRQLSQKLPKYMIPSFYQIKDELPRLPNGKINRSILKVENSESEKVDENNRESLSPTELIMFNIWSVILKTRSFTKTDNFFNIGGNSILAILVTSKIRSVFNIELGLRRFFESPIITDLAEAIDILTHKNENKEISATMAGNSHRVTGEI